MSRFRFRLQPILELRRAARDRARHAVADAEHALLLVDREIAATRERREARKGARSGTVAVNQLIDEDRYRLQIDAVLRDLVARRGQVAAEVDKRQQHLVAADREVRQLERLREAAEREHREATLRRTQREFDEIAALRHARRAALDNESPHPNPR